MISIVWEMRKALPPVTGRVLGSRLKVYGLKS
jgi:hypothetical protein